MDGKDNPTQMASKALVQTLGEEHSDLKHFGTENLANVVFGGLKQLTSPKFSLSPKPKFQNYKNQTFSVNCLGKTLDGSLKSWE